MNTQTKEAKETMVRLHLYVPKVMEAKLRELSNESGAPVAEIVRRAVAMYLLGLK